jgi:hypothetical protein
MNRGFSGSKLGPKDRVTWVDNLFNVNRWASISIGYNLWGFGCWIVAVAKLWRRGFWIGKFKISPLTVSSLIWKWQFTTMGDVSATPATFGGIIYFPSLDSNIYAIFARQMGLTIWEQILATLMGVLVGHSEPAPTSAPSRMDDMWSGNSFLLGSCSLSNHGG